MTRKTLLALAATLLCLAAATLASCGDEESQTPVPPTGGSGGSGAIGGAGGAGGAAAGIQIHGLSASVDVVYDEFGIVHLTCQTDDDCFAAMGYVHAANRFFVMDFVRHAMRGQLAGMVEAGDLVLESDYYYRQLFTTREGRPLEDAIMEAASTEVSSALERYAAGVNAWIEDVQNDRNDAQLTIEYEFAVLADVPIRPWEPEDTIAMAFYMMEDLGNTVPDELRYADMVASLSPELAADLLMVRPPFDDFTIGSSGGSYNPQATGRGPAGPAFEELQKRLAPARSLMRKARARLGRINELVHGASEFTGGSNNWVVAADRSTSGNPLLANDPHLGMSNPAVFLPMEIDSKTDGTGTLHMAGGTIPALPTVLTGHNEDLAWGVTTAVYDLNEIYVEEINAAGTEVMFEGNWVPVTTREFTFANAAGDPVDRTFKWVPHHGPIIEEDLAGGVALSLRWVLHEGMTDIQAFLGLARASQVSEVPTVLADLTCTDQNFVVADRQGNIGWYPMAKIPNRPWASLALPSWAPVPGDGSAEWNGFIAPGDLPQLSNPPAGIIATANQDITGDSADGDPTNDGHPVLQGFDTAPGVRMHRIIERLEDGGSAHTVDTLLQLQSDTHSVVGEVIVPPLLQELQNATLTAAGDQVVQALQAWQYTCPSGIDGADPAGAKDSDPTRAQESIGCSAFHTSLYLILSGALADEETAADVAFFIRSKINLLITDLTDPGQLATAGSFWDDVESVPVETRLDVLTAAIDEAGSLLTAEWSDPDDWRWGRLHTVSYASIYASFGISTYDEGPFVNDGALYTVDVAAPKGVELDMTQGWGATVRIVTEAAPDGMHMKFQHAGGTSLDRESPFYNTLLDRYLRNEPIDFPFGPGAVTDPALQQTFHPAD